MAAQSIDSFVLAFSDPKVDQDLNKKSRVNSTISFNHLIDDNIRTLSTNAGGSGDDIEGLLYVPDLPPSDPCMSESTQFIPKNATRLKDLPSVNILLVALVPWINQNCTKAFLAAAHGAQAFITYLPDDQRTIPPPANDPVWAMGDGGQWKAINQYPVYAIPGDIGALLMGALNQYSRSAIDVPNGATIAEDYNFPAYVRLYVTVGTSSASSLPSLWAFLLIVLGIVLFLIFLTSAIMHYYQRRNRQALRRRVIAGEVNLENLGIKRMTVPQHVIDKLPLYSYTSGKEPNKYIPQRPEVAIPPNPGVSPWRLTTTPRSVSEPVHLVPPPLASPSLPPSYSQPTCSICLDEFTHTTTVRQLPCQHIYHPTCIDRVLHEYSSLCPICKASVLPPGYCPATITNAMVRRERLIRERSASIQNPGAEEAEAAAAVAAVQRPIILGHRLPSFQRQFRRASRPPNWAGRRISSAPATSSLEMIDHHSDSLAGANSRPPTLMVQHAIPPALGRTRSEFGRNRMGDFLSHHRDPDEEEGERRARLPKWRKAVGSVFPGFR